MNKPIISVVICTYNNADLLPYCLDSLIEQTLNKDLYEVIIVNNNSIDNTQQIIDHYLNNNINFLQTTEINQGLAHARNTGWRMAKGKYVAFIDDDAMAAPNWCQKIIDAFENVSPKPIAVGGSIDPWYEVKPPKWFSNDFETRNWGDRPHFLTGIRAKYGFSGSNMAFPLSKLKKYKGFAINYGRIGNEMRMGEDTELFFRIHKSSPFFWYDPKIKVFHWTPIVKMNIKYRLLRSYKTGYSLALIEQPNISLLKYGRRIISFLFLLLKIPYYVILIPKSKKSFHIKLLQQIAYNIGVLMKQSHFIHGIL